MDEAYALLYEHPPAQPVLATRVVHMVKMWPEPFRLVRSGQKTFELRRDDCGFKVGDTLSLGEFDPVTEQFSGECERRRISSVLRNAPELGLQPGFCILSLTMV